MPAEQLRLLVDRATGLLARGEEDTKTGTVTGHLHQLHPGAGAPGGGNLHAWAVSGCSGLINNGDPQPVSGRLTVTPKQTITSP